MTVAEARTLVRGRYPKARAAWDTSRIESIYRVAKKEWWIEAPGHRWYWPMTPTEGLAWKGAAVAIGSAPSPADSSGSIPPT